MTGVLVVSVLALIAVAYVIAPLRRREEPEGDLLSTEIRDAEERKTAALTAIVDVEEEARVGKLSLAELESLRDEYEREALRALDELDRLHAPVAAEDPLEAEIAEMKRRYACPSCGAMREPGATCPRCGA